MISLLEREPFAFPFSIRVMISNFFSEAVLFSAAAGALRSVLFGDFPYHLPDLGDESVYENRFVRREIRHDSLSPDIKSTGRSVMLNIGVSREGMEKGLIKKTAAEK